MFKDHIAFGIESVYRSFYVSVVCLSVHLSVCFSLSVCPFFHSSVRPYLCPLSVSLSLSLSPFIRLFLRQSMCLSVYMVTQKLKGVLG